MTHNGASELRFEAATFLYVLQMELQLHGIISIADFDIKDFVIIMGVRVLFCSSSGQEFMTHNIINRKMDIFHTCNCRNALDICSLAASFVGGISSGLLIECGPLALTQVRWQTCPYISDTLTFLLGYNLYY